MTRRFAPDRAWRVAPFVALAALVLAPGADAAAAPAATSFDPVAFFSGRTTGEGRLKKAFSAAQATHVVSLGKVEDGVLVLDQTVKIDGDKDRNREWRLHKVSQGRYEGTLTDAKGLVVATLERGVLHIAYSDKDGFAFRQVLTLAPGGRQAHNAMKVRRFGLTVATLDETITRD